MSGFTNRPRVLRGAFVEAGISIPPLVVPFQFNPVELQRTRSLSFRAPNDVVRCGPPSRPGAPEQQIEREPDLRQWHGRFDDLDELRRHQIVTIAEESINLELRLDATDDLDRGNPLAQQFGIASRIAVLEQMTQPKQESLLGAALGSLLGPSAGHAFTGGAQPPMVLFIWGVQRVLPINITSLGVTETEFDPALHPLRATVSVSFTVVEGPNAFSTYTDATREVMAALNLANLVTDVAIPG
jgi:hypothetical protein